MFLSFFALVTSPATPLPCEGAAPCNFSQLVTRFLDIIGLLIPFLFGLALIVFLWGITNAWILGGGDETKIEHGKKIALAGVIGLVVMAGVWGIVALFGSVFH
ncbi:hypothetical protein HY416_01060 [Candidatus Kaiserbacteria bacterium]|nr:hypothetical protein [Candidatus Kaiserbacteria bacterium]